MRARSSAATDAAMLRQMLGVVSDAIVATDLAGRVIEWNSAATRLLGWTATEMLGERYEDMVRAELDPTDTALIAACGMLGQMWSGRVRARRRDGSAVLLHSDRLPLHDPTGRVVGTVSLAAPLSTPDDEQPVTAGSDWLMLLRLDGGVPYLSQAMYDALGLPVGLELLLVTVVHPEDRDELQRLLAPADRPDAVTLRLRGADRDYQSFRFRVNDLTAAEPGALLLTGHAIDEEHVERLERRPAADVLEQRAHARVDALSALTDPLTGLPNGVLLAERLQALLDRLADAGTAAAVLYLDVDDFSAVNEQLGERAGDELLVVLGRRLRRALRTEETVGRFGNDEFVVCAEVDDDAGAAAIANRLTSVLGARTVVDGHELAPTIGVGIAITRDGNRSPESLLREADAAVHQAQEHGRAQLTVFDQERRRRRAAG
jgi:diguanylate cyclase (GGDEF)-like protein/PAS domain S-box-containing protein